MGISARIVARLLAGAALLAGLLPASPAAADSYSCQNVFAASGVCTLTVPALESPASVTVWGDAISAAGLDARIRVWLEDVVTGARLAECMATSATTDVPVQISCNRTEALRAATPLAATCNAEGMLAGRFGCDVVL